MHRKPTVTLVALAGAFLTGCSAPDATAPASGDPPMFLAAPGQPAPVPPDDGLGFGPTQLPLPAPVCDHSIQVQSDSSALLVRDPATLAGFTLERVLKQLIRLSPQITASPEQMLQRLFDTENTTAGGVFSDVPHCDGPGNIAFKTAPATDCPRAEGALAKSHGFFVPGNPDYFAPVALVNRFDLTGSGGESCGEYRIVFAKWSGRSDPNNRVFLIFEGALPIPPGASAGWDDWQLSKVEMCRPVARLWADVARESDPEVSAANLEAFYFDGIQGFDPVIHPTHFALGPCGDDTYAGGALGQVRVSQRMQEPWEMREFKLGVSALASGSEVAFVPVTVKNNPSPDMFDTATPNPLAQAFRSMFLSSAVPGLAQATSAAGVRMQIFGNFNAGESAIGGAAGSDYAERAASGAGGPAFLSAIEGQSNPSGIQVVCPTGDPVTAEAILNRASTQTCAGCHAPEKFLGPERKIGCGLVWPKTLGGAHIDELGQLSPALTDVFLPHRASVMTTFLQACDRNAVKRNLLPTQGGGGCGGPK